LTFHRVPSRSVDDSGLIGIFPLSPGYAASYGLLTGAQDEHDGGVDGEDVCA
jgi:hypothetical protein